MAEEQQEQSTGGSLKNVIIGFISTITLGVGGFITTKLTGGDEKEQPTQQAAPVINIQNNQTQQQSAGGKTVIVKEAAKPADQPKPKKKEGDEFKEEAPKW
jgi:flagellar basal body-associated protein FliL